MNKKIKEQLDKCELVLPTYDDSTTELIIPKGASLKKGKSSIVDYEVYKEYIIEVENYVLYPPDGFDLHINWNNGSIPTDKRMKIRVDQIMGNMIKVSAVGMNDHKFWWGWLPKKSTHIISGVDK